MKKILIMLIAVLLVFSCSVSAFALLPPWLRTAEDRIIHAEGRDENDPYFAYDEQGSKYYLSKVYVGFNCEDHDEAMKIAENIISYAKALPGVSEADCPSVFYPYDGFATYYEVFVWIEYPFDTYDTVYEALKSYPGITRVNRAWSYTAPSKTQLYYGDVDFNAVLTAADARQILRYGVSLDTPEDYHISCGDLNGDGVLTAADARACLRTVVGLDEKQIYAVVLTESLRPGDR